MIKVIIADDQEMISKSLSIVLHANPDIEVAGTASNGEIALELTGQVQPDIILMDIQMPVMDGVEATRRIKQLNPQQKVIILTTFQDVKFVTDALHAGAEGYILKAIDPLDLATAIKLVHRGETMISQEVAKALFTHMKVDSSSKVSEYGLSDREIQVLKCISDGLSNRLIADKLFLSEGTVKNYISSIYSKLNVHNRSSVLKKVNEEQLL